MWIGQSQQISISLPADQIEALKRFTEASPYKPTLSRIVQVGMTEFLQRNESDDDRVSREKRALVEEAEQAGVNVTELLTNAMRKAIA